MKRVKRCLGGLCGALACLMAGQGLAQAQLTSAAQRQVLSLDVYRDGATLHLLTGEREAGENSAMLLYRRSADDGRSWSAPEAVNRHSVPFGLRRGADAQIAADGRHLVAAWTVGGSGADGSGPIATAISGDGGKTWKAGDNPADDNSDSAHGAIDIVAAQGSFHMVWLDARDATGPGLRYARSGDGGQHWQANVTVAARTGECGWNSLLAGIGPALYVLYRDREPRDMSLAVSSDGGGSWKEQGALAPFGWEAKTCPPVGGALVSAAVRTLDALSWTGDGHAGLYHLRSADGGDHWGDPQRIGGDDARHADLAADGAGHLAVVWDAAGETQVLAQTSADGGAHWSAARRLSAEGVRPTHPRVVPTADGFLALWTQTGVQGASALATARIGR